jgi:hypothetical protein
MSHDSLHVYVDSDEVTQRNTRLIKDMEQGSTVLVTEYVVLIGWLFMRRQFQVCVKYILKCCS